MTFAILFMLILIMFGILSLVGTKPFKKKSNEIGAIFICVGLFLGFYPGMLFGHLILYLVNKCIPSHEPQLTYQV